MATTISPNMGLTIPVVSQQPGPDYASNINLSLNTVDSHDHSTGQGVQITPSGINISSDLPFLENNATRLRTSRYTAQVSPLSTSSTTDVACVYVAGVDLYYNDANGNQVRLTQSGGVAGTAGSIANLVSPASATYVGASQKFVWQSDTNVAASLDARNIILRNSNASSFGVTVQPPAAMSVDYNLILPAVPGSQSFMTLDGSGNITAPVVYPLPTSGIANSAITREKQASVGQITSSAIALFTTTALTDGIAADTTTITTTGRPVVVMLQTAGSGATGYVELTTTGPAVGAVIGFNRNVGSSATTISQSQFGGNTSSASASVYPPGMFTFLDTPAAGTYTYSVLAKVTVGTVSALSIVNSRIAAYEL